MIRFKMVAVVRVHGLSSTRNMPSDFGTSYGSTLVDIPSSLKPCTTKVMPHASMISFFNTNGASINTSSTYYNGHSHTHTHPTGQHTQHPLMQIHDRVILSFDLVHLPVAVDTYEQIISQLFCSFQNFNMSKICSQLPHASNVEKIRNKSKVPSMYTTLSPG